MLKPCDRLGLDEMDEGVLKIDVFSTYMSALALDLDDSAGSSLDLSVTNATADDCTRGKDTDGPSELIDFLTKSESLWNSELLKYELTSHSLMTVDRHSIYCYHNSEYEKGPP